MVDVFAPKTAFNPHSFAAVLLAGVRRGGSAVFEETPVPLDTFLTDSHYLGLSPLSQLQSDYVEHGTQIYFQETLDTLGWFPLRYITEGVAFWGKGCIAAGSKVFDAYSGVTRNVEDCVSLPVVGVTTIDKNQKAVTAPAIVIHTGKDMCYRVVTTGGHEIVCNAKHPLLGRAYRHSNNGRYTGLRYKPLSQFTVGDDVALSSNVTVVNGVSIPVAQARLLGYWIGDGVCCTENEDPFLLVHKGSKGYYDVLQCLQEVGDYSYEREHQCKGIVCVYPSQGGGNNKPSAVRKLLRASGLAGHSAYNKFIPDVFFRADEKSIANLLVGMFHTDGCIEAPFGYISYCSVSKELIYGLQRLLLRVGVSSKVRVKETASDFGVAYELRVGDSLNMNRFASVVGAIPDKPYIHTGEGRRLDNSIYWCKIQSITPVGEMNIYDFKVGHSEHNYVSYNGFISHNSGKDMCARIIMARITYLLLCLKNPQQYYNLQPDDNIDMLNMAYSAPQAEQVFFEPFATMIARAPWFKDKFSKRRMFIEFDKKIKCHSGHSDAESAEGKNLICVVLDEISAFKTKKEITARRSRTLREPKQSADGIYQSMRSSVISRFPQVGKVLLLSFPRFKGDYIMQAYERGVSDNRIRGSASRIYVTKGCTWEVNPTKTKEDFAEEFRTNPEEAKSKYACDPPLAVDSYFKNKDAVKGMFCNVKDWDFEDRPLLDTAYKPTWEEGFVPRLHPDFHATHRNLCAIHLDLSLRHDRAGFSMSHQSGWDNKAVPMTDDSGRYIVTKERVPIIENDLTCWFQAPMDGEIELASIRDLIFELRRRGFCIGIITADGFQSADTFQIL